MQTHSPAVIDRDDDLAVAERDRQIAVDIARGQQDQDELRRKRENVIAEADSADAQVRALHADPAAAPERAHWRDVSEGKRIEAEDLLAAVKGCATGIAEAHRAVGEAEQRLSRLRLQKKGKQLVSATNEFDGILAAIGPAAHVWIRALEDFRRESEAVTGVPLAIVGATDVDSKFVCVRALAARLKEIVGPQHAGQIHGRWDTNLGNITELVAGLVR